MADQTSLIVLRYVNKTPSLASCAKCQRKFFTPNTYYNDPVSAEQYLRDKFELHDCSEEPKRTKGGGSSNSPLVAWQNRIRNRSY